MARSRFPGRPGCRADRVGIPYCADDVNESTDPALQFIANLHRGLQEFKEICGESEDDDFYGFSEEDVRLSGKKLRATIRAEQKLQGSHPGPSRVEAERRHDAPHTSSHKASEHHATPSSHPKPQKLQGIFGSVGEQSEVRPLSKKEIKQKALAAKQLLASLKAKHKHAQQGRVMHNKVGRPRKHPAKPVQPIKKIADRKLHQKQQQKVPTTAAVLKSKIVSKKADRKSASHRQSLGKLPAKPAPSLKKAEKSLRVKSAEEVKLKWQGVKKKQILTTESKSVRLSKDRPKSVVKQLLQKAKQAGSRPLPNVKAGGQKSNQTMPQKRVVHTFVLPKFSRSRRAIIPNKRFIEDDPIPSALLIKRPRIDFTSPPDPPTPSSERKAEKAAVSSTPTPIKKSEKPKTPVPPVTPPPSSSKKTPKQTPVTSSASLSSNRKAGKSSIKPESTPVPKSSTKAEAKKASGSAKQDTTPAPKCSAKAEAKKAVETTASAEQLQQLEMSPVVAVTPHKLETPETECSHSDLLMTAESSPFRKGLLEQPLIVEGKRQRVPSLKVRLTKHQSEESVPSPEIDCGETSSLLEEEPKQNGSRKEKFTLFPKAPASAPKTFNRAGPMKLQRRDKDGKESTLTKRSGQIIMRKAKLQLNRTALNRSKAALARSLKAQLKREAKQKGRRSEPQRHSPRPGVTSPLSISVLGSGASHPFDSPNSQPSPLLASLSPGSQGGFASPPRIVSTLSPISLPSKKDTGEVIGDKPKEATAEKTESGGPRIKHVCRRAAVVLPKPLATFPAPPDPSESPTLSALPSPEKEKLLQSQAANRAENRDSSDDEMAAPSRKSQVIRRAGMKKVRPRLRIRRRKGRCKECTGCLAPNCGKCTYCLDSKKFGGKNILKKACVNRTCQRPIYSKQATNAFIQPKAKGGEGDEVDSTQVRQGPARLARPSAGFFSAIGDQPQEEGAQDEGEGGRAGSLTPPPDRPRQRVVRAQQHVEPEEGGINEGGLEIMSAVRMERNDLTYHARRLLKRKQKAGVRVRLPTVVPQPQPLQGLSTFWSVAPNTRSIVHTQLKDQFCLDVTWIRGLALTMAGPTCMRAVCFLCGSAGREKLLYCSVCCEPFHWFCLDEEDRPLEGCSTENWCCRRCQFCHVCGLQSCLLQCDRCQDTYHPHCLGPAYPKQPSRRNVWVCTKCVKCKSCGATTPGSGHNATWTYDFSLCFECGKLMDKGNFCPICRKCYADDDWESKMVQCSICDSWVHARCEGLTDEMYQLFSYLPEDIQYRCQMCSPTDPPEWKAILREELFSGLQSVLTGLTSFKCAQHLLVIDEAKEKERLQRALQKKKPQSTVATTEGAASSITNVRTSPRVRRHSHTSQPSSSEKSVIEADDDRETGTSQKNPGDELPSEDKPTIDLSPRTPKSDEKEKSAVDVVEVSDSETKSPTKPSHSPQPADSECDLGSSARGSQDKATKMSEVGIFERLAQGCADPSESDQGQSCAEENTTGDKTDSQCPVKETKAQCSADSGNEKSETQCSGTEDCSPHNSCTGESIRDSSSTQADSTSQQLSCAATTQASKLAGSNPSQDTMQVSLAAVSIKNPASVARNLFETFLAASDAGHSEEQGELPSTECSEQASDAQEKPDQIVDKENTFQPVAGDSSDLDRSVNSATVEVSETTKTASEGESASTAEGVSPDNAVSPKNVSGDNFPVNATSDNAPKNDSDSSGDSVVVKTNNEEDVHQSSSVVTQCGSPLGSASAQSTSEGSAAAQSSSSLGSVARSSGKHVSVTITGVSEGEESRAVALRNERQFPRDFNTIRMKLESGRYTSVEDFNEDMVHIIQTALSDDEQFPTRRKHSNSVRSIFIKQMERVFPWFNVKTCHLWHHNWRLPQGMLPDAVVPPYNDHTYAQWLEREMTLSSPQLSPFKRLMASPVGDGTSTVPHYVCEDLRQCVLCLEVGDDFPDEAGRLLYAGQDDWVHVNCALWSAEVFEESDGILQNVHVAMVRGRQMRCDRCRAQGATVGCCVRGCPSNFHFLCARRQHCVFKEDKTVYCYQHREQASGQVENQKGFAVERRLCVAMADVRCMKKSWARGLDAAFVNILFGSCTVESLGMLATLSDCKGCLLPMEFRCSRVYWSTVDARRRTVYTCRIVEVRPAPPTPELVLRDVRVVHDEQHPDYVPLDALDLPSMGLSHLLPPNDDVIFVSQASPVKSLLQPSLTISEHSGAADSGLAAQNSGAPVTKLRKLIENSAADLRQSDSSDAVNSASGGSLQVTSASGTKSSGSGGVFSRQGLDYSKLSASTLKMLNISDPKQVASLPGSVPTRPATKGGEFGNLTGMVERLNSAAMRSKKSSGPKKSSTPLQRNKRCSSADRWTPMSSSAMILKRSASLSPGGSARSSSPFSPTSLRSPPVFQRSLSPDPSLSGSTSYLAHKAPTVTPILEQLENELTEESGGKKSTPVIQRKRKRPSSAPARREEFVDLTLDSDVSDSAVNSQSKGEGGSRGDSGDGDVELAQHILETVPKEILEGSEVKVLVVPENVSEEEAIQLAQEALLQSNQTQQEQATEGEVSSEQGESKTDKKSSGLRSVEIQDGDTPKPADSDSCENVEKDPKEKDGAASQEEDCVITKFEMVKSLPKGSSSAEQLVRGCKEIKQEFLTDEDQSVTTTIDNTASPGNASTDKTAASSVTTTDNTASGNAVISTDNIAVSSVTPTDNTASGSSAITDNAASGTNLSHDAKMPTSQPVSGIEEATSQTPMINVSVDLPPTSTVNQTQTTASSVDQSECFISSISQSQNSCSTSSLKMAETVEVAPVYDKMGNLIGQRKRRPYVVETVKTTSTSIDIKRDLGTLALRNPRMPPEHFRLSLPPKTSSDTLEDSGKHSDVISPLEKTDVVGECEEQKNTASCQDLSAVADSHDCEGEIVTEMDEAESSLADAEAGEAAADLGSDDISGEVTGTDNKITEAASLDSVVEDSDKNIDNETCREVKTPQKMLSQNSGETADLETRVDPSIKLPRDIDAKRLQCSVNVRKLCLDDLNGSISVKNLCELHGVNSCSAAGCSSRDADRTVSSPQTVESGLLIEKVQENADSKNSESSVDSAEVVKPEICSSAVAAEGSSSTQGMAETEENLVQEKGLSSTTPVDLNELRLNLNNVSSSTNKLCKKLDLTCPVSVEECDELIKSVIGKPLCNGLDKCDVLSQNIMSGKDCLKNIALNPPPSVDNTIAESLRTVQCRVSLERLAGAAKGENCPQSSENPPENNQGDGQNSSEGAHGQPCSTAAESSTQGSANSHVRSQNGGHAESSVSSVSAVKAASPAHSFDRSFLDCLKQPPGATQTAWEAGDENTEVSNGVNGEFTSEGFPSSSAEKHSEQGFTSSSEPQQSQEAASDGSREDGESLPLHTEIALRIKAESLARSSPGERGPFKCPTCKRLYRTVDSFQAHAQSCDFDVSTSDEDDEGDEDNAHTRSEGDSKDEEESKSNLRTSLRQSTLTQRKAMESSQQQLAQQAAEKVTTVITGKPPKTPQAVDEVQVNRGRGRPRKSFPSGDETTFQSSLEAVYTGRGRPRKLSLLSTFQDDGMSPQETEPIKRGRGRPRKVPHQPPEKETSDLEKPMEQLSPKQSMLGAVGLVSKDCLELQASAVKASETLVDASQSRSRSRRASAHSPPSVVRRCRSRKSSQTSESHDNEAVNDQVTVDMKDLCDGLELQSSFSPVENKSISEAVKVLSERLDLIKDSEQNPVKSEHSESASENEHKVEQTNTIPDKTEPPPPDQTELPPPDQTEEPLPESSCRKPAVEQESSADPVSDKKEDNSGNSLTSLPSSARKTTVHEDSDQDSDVIFVDEEPAPSGFKPSLSGSGAGNGSMKSTLPKALGDVLSGFLPDMKDVTRNAEWKTLARTGTVAEKHRTTSPILSRLASSLSASAVNPQLQSPLKINVEVNVTRQTPQTTQSVVAPASSGTIGATPALTTTVAAAAANTTTVSTTPAHAAVASLTHTQSAFSCPESYKSQSSLLLSSSNVQADIDSDDLSFTDSEEEETDMDTNPVVPPTRPTNLAKLLDSPLQVTVDTAPAAGGSTKTECPKTPEAQTSQFLSMLDKLSPDQKVVLTQQLLKTGALNIEEPRQRARSQASSVPQQITIPQNAMLQSPRPVMGPGGQSGFVGQASTQQVMPSSSTLRIVSTPGGVGSGQLAIFPQQDSVVVRQSPGLQPALVSQASVQIVQQRPSIMVRHSVLPVASVTSLTSPPPFAPSPGVSHPLAPSLSTLSAAGSATLNAAGLLAPQATPTVLCPQPSVLNALTPQPVVPASSQNINYMGSFLVDPAKSTDSEEKARLQLLSLIQGAMSTPNASGATPTPAPSPLTSVAGACVAPSTASHQPRVIRVVLDKSFSSDQTVAARLTSGTVQPLVRIVQVSPAPPPPPMVPVVTPTIPAVPPSSTPVLPAVNTLGTVCVPSQPDVDRSCLLPDSMMLPALARKRPASTPLPMQAPPAKRAMILPVERNGIIQGQFGDMVHTSCLQDKMIQPTVSVASSSSSIPALQSKAASSTIIVKEKGAQHGIKLNREQASTTLAGIRNLLKHRMPSRGKKQNMLVRKDVAVTSASGGAVKSRLKARTEKGPVKKKVVRAPKGGPLSHPIVHLSHQAGAMLPQAEVEEEIRDTPLRNTQFLPPSQQSNVAPGNWPKDMPRLAFEITAEDGFSCRADTMEEAWRQVTDKVQDARTAARMKQLSYAGLNGVQMFGVGHDAVVYLVEQLAGARHCRQYKFRYQDYEPQEEDELSINPSGCARCTPFTTRKPYDVFSFLMSRHRHRPCKVDNNSKEEEMEHKSSRRATSMELPMAMRFRKLQEHAKEAVGVYRSKIHGRGLFCKRNIDNGEMVIEYSGEIIRSLLTDKREKYYESKGIGCYMFRIDDCEVVDATMHGSAARFINHSCEPNCYSKVINVDGKKHIVIFASRAIKKGEELTYDYKFPIEDVKIPCTCGSRKCRKYLN